MYSMETDTNVKFIDRELGTIYSKLSIVRDSKPKSTKSGSVGMWQMTLGKVLDLAVPQFLHLSFPHLISSFKGFDQMFSNVPFGSKVLGYHNLLKVTQLVQGRAGARIYDWASKHYFFH